MRVRWCRRSTLTSSWLTLILVCHQDNLHKLDVINRPEKFDSEVDAERLNNFFLTRLLLNTEADFNVPVSSNVPQFSSGVDSCNRIYKGHKDIVEKSSHQGQTGIKSPCPIQKNPEGLQNSSKRPLFDFFLGN
jgi:hypothetical protein